MIKLIATDMDGTLLDSRKRLPPDTLPVVRALKARGVSFVIASGRQYAALRRDLPQLAQEIIFMAENGALVMENDRRLFIDPLDQADVPAIVRAAGELDGVYPVVCRAGCALIAADAPAEFVRNVRMYYAATQTADDLEAACEGLDDVCKVAFYESGRAAVSEYPALQKRLGGRHAVILSGADWVDVMKPGAHKGSAMRMLQRIKGVGPENCMAFGDYLNDKEMLESVEESYAMENALDEIKAAAKYIAPSNDEDGVMRTIRERFSL